MSLFKRCVIFAALLAVVAQSVLLANPSPAFAQSESGVVLNLVPRNRPKITDPAQRRARWEWVRREKAKVFERTGSWEAVEEWLKDNGFVVVHGYQEPITIQSTNQDVTYNVAVYYDPDTAEYLIQGTWRWKTWPPSSDLPSYCGSRVDVGGYDAGGIWISNPNYPNGLRITSSWMDTFDYNSRNRTHSTVAWDWNQYGVVHRTQDYCWQDSSVPGGKNYSHYRGAVNVVVDVGTVHSTTYLKLTYGHTWSQATISNVIIGTSGIAMSFTSGSYAWQGTSSPLSWKY